MKKITKTSLQKLCQKLEVYCCSQLRFRLDCFRLFLSDNKLISALMTSDVFFRSSYLVIILLWLFCMNFFLGSG